MDANEAYERIGEYIESHPSESYGQVGSALHLSRAAIARIAKLHGIRRRPGRKPSALVAAPAAALETASPGSALAGEAAEQSGTPMGPHRTRRRRRPPPSPLRSQSHPAGMDNLVPLLGPTYRILHSPRSAGNCPLVA
ncbi:MAG: hypothetical protein ACLQOO_09505 [Terriglobia bacterium]